MRRIVFGKKLIPKDPSDKIYDQLLAGLRRAGRRRRPGREDAHSIRELLLLTLFLNPSPALSG